MEPTTLLVTTSARLSNAAETIFAIHADPTTHAVDCSSLTSAGHFLAVHAPPGTPDGNYQTSNLLEKFDPPSTIA
jgi:hypothetical protein